MPDDVCPTCIEFDRRIRKLWEDCKVAGEAIAEDRQHTQLDKENLTDALRYALETLSEQLDEQKKHYETHDASPTGSA